MILPKASKKIGISLLTCVALGLTLLFSAPVRAQVSGATLSGTVTDASGAVVPQAQISIKNVATGIAASTRTNADGLYSEPNLLPGDYEVTLSAAGFKTEVRSGINLTVGEQQVLNISLQVGQATQQVEVTGAAPAVELASSTINAVVSSNTVVDLPLNGRDWTQLAALQPGVSSVTTETSENVPNTPRGNHGFGQQMTISGTRPQLNNYRLDGISIVDYAGSAPGSVLGAATGVDAVAEFSVLTSNQSAEYGRTSGGVINAITRSGTNQIHGDAYEFLRNSDVDARNFFAGTNPPFRRNQFGASAGGPIQKDKTFFFFDYEGLREFLGASNVDLVPSATARNGILNFASPAAFPSGCAPTSVPNQCAVTVNALVKPFFGFYPLPNAGLVGLGNTGHFDVTTNDISTSNFETARIDRRISEKDSVFGTWFLDRSVDAEPDPLNNVSIGNHSGRQMVAVEERHIFSPSLVNTLRGGFSRVATVVAGNLTAINPLVTDNSLGSFPGLPAPQILVPGLTNFSGGGQGTFTANLFTWNSFQGYDDAFLTKGVHSIKLGFAFERMQSNMTLPATPTGQFSFGSLANFLTNQPTAFKGQLTSTISPRGIRQSLFGGYVQDDWRFRPNLTLNLGLRYEMTTVPTEVQNKLVNLPTFTSPAPGHLGSPYFNNPTLRNFEPRVGFSWDPSHNGKTAVRGAFGMFDALPLNYEFINTEIRSAPFAETLSEGNLAPGTFPTGAAATSAINPSKLVSQSIQPSPPRNYVMIWNLNVQRQLDPSTSVMVGYVGNHGVHMLDREDDANSVLPTATPQGFLWPSPTGSGTKLNPDVGQLYALYWAGDSESDALELQVTKRMSHGFQVQGSYTWGKNIDTGSSSTTGQEYLNSIKGLFWFCKSCRRSVSDYNIAQTLVVNYLWDLPTPNNWGAIGSHVLGGWTVGGIITAETGVPITPLLGGDPLGLKSIYAFDNPNRLSGPGCASDVNPGNPSNYIKLNCFAAPNPLTLFGNAGRNAVVGPGIANLDFSVFKNNYIKRISESFNVQFRAEFFNILNRANFATPVDNQVLFDVNGNPVADAGAVDQTSTAPREIQFALKLIW